MVETMITETWERPWITGDWNESVKAKSKRSIRVDCQNENQNKRSDEKKEVVSKRYELKDKKRRPWK